MKKCPACKELISHSALSYKVSAGFQNEDGSFHEDIELVVHQECSHDYTFNPFIILEKRLKDGD